MVAARGVAAAGAEAAGGAGGAAVSFGAVGKTKLRLLRPCIERLWLCVSKRAAMKCLPSFAGLIRCDVEFKKIAILVALVVLFAVMVRLSAGHLLPADLKHIIFR